MSAPPADGYCPNLTYEATTNRLTTSGYSYDAAGSLTGDGTHSYQWDGEGRLRSVDNGSTMSLTYDAFGRQVKELSGWENAFDASGQWIGRYNSNSGTWEVKSVFKLGGRMLAMQGSTWTRFVHPNALGSTTLNTDHSGAPGGDILFYPWGQIWSSLNPAEYHFAGFDYRSTAADLDPTLFRDYASGIGRWLSPDPVAGDPGNPQSLNRYAYVVNNPASFIDPLGLGDEDCTWDPSTNTLTCPPPPGPTGRPPCSLIYQVPGCVAGPIGGYPGGLGRLGSYAGGVGVGPGVGPGGKKGNKPLPTPTEAATRYCQEKGQIAFNIPFTNIPVTVSVSGTLGVPNYSWTNDWSMIIPTSPAPSLGISFDVTVNAPTQPSLSANVGAGKNLSVGTFLTRSGPQGLTFSVGPSIGPPVTISAPMGNTCGQLAPKGGG